MTWGGWLTMAISVGFVATLFFWCIWRVLFKQSGEGHIHAMEDIDMGED